MENTSSVDQAFLRIKMAFEVEDEYEGFVCKRSGPVGIRRYANGRLEIEIFADDGEPLYEATVWYPWEGYDAGEFGVWLEGENREADAKLVDAGIITLTGRVHKHGNREFRHAELTEKARAGIVVLPQARIG